MTDSHAFHRCRLSELAAPVNRRAVREPRTGWQIRFPGKVPDQMAASFERYAYMSPKLHPVESPEKGGHGLIAREPIQAGERLLVWGGAIVDHDRLKKLPAILQRRSVQVDDGLYLVTPVKDEPADYINHSCAPNAGLQGQLTVVAMRAI
ncbi:MAG TPA: SET domain-containing protein, partial [Anaerolineales bacterium]|nr:SET domain-containing protein [Anaerolineales bacterium]